MQVNYKKSIIASVLALVVATACCWLPWLVIMLGGAAGLAGLSEGLDAISLPFIIIAGLLLGVGVYQFYNKKPAVMEPVLKSVLTCPHCQHQKEELMPTNACQYFYECENCKEILKPMNNDCCVYCSYGTVPCPPIQMDEACC